MNNDNEDFLNQERHEGTEHASQGTEIVLEKDENTMYVCGFHSAILMCLLAFGGGVFRLIEYPFLAKIIEDDIEIYNELKSNVMEVLLNFTEKNETAVLELYSQLQEYEMGFQKGPIVKDDWNFQESCVFSFTIITLIGYGTHAPKSLLGQMFLIVYACIGIPICLLTVKQLADGALYVFTWMSKIGQDKVKEAFDFFDDDGSGSLQKDEFKNALSKLECNPTDTEFEKLWTEIDNDGGGTIDLEEFRKSINSLGVDVLQAYSKNRVIVSLIGILFWLVFGMVVFHFTEEWDLFETIYFIIVSLTTIGLGDVFPNSGAGVVFLFAYATIGLGLVAVLLTLVEGSARNFARKLTDYAQNLKSDSQNSGNE